MLILGEPGAGKTTTLLELAEYLLLVAEDEADKPIPFVFNLSSWAKDRKPLMEWLTEEFKTVYKVNSRVGRAWLHTTPFPFTLLLDGLDEVKTEYRAACIDAINDFSTKYGPLNTVVCCRTEDYAQTGKQLHSLGAVTIRPLTREQIDDYFEADGTSQSSAHEAVKNNTWLQELVTAPLFLNVIAFTFRNREVTLTGKDAQYQLWSAYIARVFEHRLQQVEYGKQQAVHWLAYLATQMTQHSETEFFIERLQPDWLLGAKPRRLYRLIVGLFGEIHKITPYEKLGFSWKSGLILGLISGLIFGLLVGLGAGPVSGMIFGLSAGSIGMLRGGLVGREAPVEEMMDPNQGIWQSGKNATLVGLFIGLLGGLFGGLIFGLAIGLLVGPLFGGFAFVQHFVLRFFLHRYGYLPGRQLVPFLDDMASRIILRKIGGGYIFIHRTLQEYFVQLYTESEDG